MHKKGHRFYDFDEIRREIENQTDAIAGTNKGIDLRAINLKIFSPNVPNLTLVDLPGITKNPVGDQPVDIENQIRGLINSYIQNPNSIILAVVPANTDMANSDALKLAKEIDSDGNRTVAVITKLDIMDEGTNATDVLCGKVIPVKLGIIGVMNRSQKNINDNKRMEDQLKDEEMFLKKNYPRLASKNGTPYLSQTLHHLLINHIKKCLPDLMKRISDMKTEQSNLLESYGYENSDKQQTALQLIIKFSKNYCNEIEGMTSNLDTQKELCGGARICKIFHETFCNAMNSITPNLLPDDILRTLRNAAGTEPPVFVPDRAFKLLVLSHLFFLIFLFFTIVSYSNRYVNKYSYF